MDDESDPMALMEQEIRRKEEREQNALNLAIGLTDFLEGRDLTGKFKKKKYFRQCRICRTVFLST